MLKVHGLVGIPRDIEVEEISLKKGTLLKFFVVSQDPYHAGTFHKYPTKIWVPSDKTKEAIAIIKSNSVFWIEHGEWVMKERDDGKIGWPALSVKWNDFNAVKLAKSSV